MDDSSIVGQAFNFGNDTPMTVLEIAKEILFLTDRLDLEPIILNQAKGEIPKQYLSSKKAREMLQWKPTHSVREGLLETIEWYKNYLTHIKR